MDGAIVAKVEKRIDAAAAALFAGAVAFAVFKTVGIAAGGPLLAALAAYFLCFALLSRVPGSATPFEISPFAIAAVPIAVEELLLTDADRLTPADPPADEPLELDDILQQLGPDSRVVRLFDPAAMPTPAQLQARIDRHLGQARPPLGADDASQALVDALTELRRSLR